MSNCLDGIRIDITDIHNTGLFEYNCHHYCSDDLRIYYFLSIVLSELIGYNIQRLSYGQANITRDNLTNSNMMVGTDTDNKWSVSGGLAVSDEGASGKKIVKK